MRRSRFSDEQIIGILKEHQAGLFRPVSCAADTALVMRPFTSGVPSTAGWSCLRLNG